MNYGEIKAAVYLAIKDNATRVSEFQVGEAINAAQSWMVNVLPAGAARDLHASASLTIGTSGAAGLPADFLKEMLLIKNEITTAGSEAPATTYRFVSLPDFMKYKDIGSYDTIAAISSNHAEVTPVPANGTIFTLTYLKAPTAYLSIVEEAPTYEGNDTVPDFSKKLHQIIVDYAAATVAQQAGDMNIYQSKMSAAYMGAKSNGAQINMGGGGKQ